MRQVLFRIPIGAEGVPIFGFGMMLLLAFVSTIWLAKRRAVKVGIDRTVIEDLAIYIFGGGILGARLCYLTLHGGFQDLQSPLDFLARLFAIWDGGIIFYGAAIGATAAYFVGWYFTFRYRPNVTTLRLADVIAPTIALGLLLGRLGCFLNGCCYGQVACETCPAVHYPMSAQARYELTGFGYQTAAGFLTAPKPAQVTHIEPGSAAEEHDLKVGDVIVKINGRETRSAAEVAASLTQGWKRGESELAITVERGGKEVDLQPFAPRTLGLQPTQLYESISMALVMLVLLAFDSVKRRDGQVMALMMICYGIHRYINEILRIDQRPVGFESYISVLLVVSGAGMMALLSFRPSAPAQAPAMQPPPA